MALTWDMTRVDDREELRTDAEWRVSEALIFATMFVGIRQITADNVEDFARRLHMWEAVSSSLLLKEDGRGNIVPRPITLEEIRRRVGLTTNATPYTDAHFRKEVLRVLAENANAWIARQK